MLRAGSTVVEGVSFPLESIFFFRIHGTLNDFEMQEILDMHGDISYCLVFLIFHEDYASF